MYLTQNSNHIILVKRWRVNLIQLFERFFWRLIISNNLYFFNCTHLPTLTIKTGTDTTPKNKCLKPHTTTSQSNHKTQQFTPVESKINMPKSPSTQQTPLLPFWHLTIWGFNNTNIFHIWSNNQRSIRRATNSGPW